MVRAVRESVFYETSADPIRFSLLGLDLITRPQQSPPLLLSAIAAGEDGGDGQRGGDEGEKGGGEEEGGGGSWGWRDRIGGFLRFYSASC